MLYFIELSQFSAEDSVITRALRSQMDRRCGSAARWAEWKADRAGAHSWPDVALINTAHLNWIQLKGVVNQCTAETIVLTGCQDSLLGLPALPYVDALDELLQFMPGRDSVTGLSTESRRFGSFVRRYGEAADTTPMPLKANLPSYGFTR